MTQLDCTIQYGDSMVTVHPSGGLDAVYSSELPRPTGKHRRHPTGDLH
jgi:hypothetical protein